MPNSLGFRVVFFVLATTMMISMVHAKATTPKGIFKVVGSDNCVFNSVGFSEYPALFELAPSTRVFNSWEATMNFLGSGQVTEVGKGQYLVPGIAQPVGTYETNCQYTSTANTDGSLTLNGACDIKVLSGVATGEEANATFIGWRIIPVANDMILLSNTSTQALYQTSNFGNVLHRICQGQGIGAR